MTPRDHLQVPRTVVDRWIAGLFIATITVPLALTLALLRTFPPDDPKQDLDPWPRPVASWKDLERWPRRFQRWFEDHYVMRRALIRAQGTLMLNAVGVSPSRTVLIGRDGWWYYTDDGAMDDIVSAEPMPEASLARWATAIGDSRAWLAQRGIPYLFVLTPDKHAVYPEFLPETVRPLGPWRGDQFAREMAARLPPGTVLSVKDALVARKSLERVFHRTDTHWNGRGALLAWRGIAAWMRDAGVEVPDTGGFEPVSLPSGGQDLPRMLGLDALVQEERLEVVPPRPRQARVVEPAGADIGAELGRLVTEHPDTSLPRIVVFRDSFMTGIMPFLAEACSRCVFVWQRDLDPAIIEQERPDIVIHQLVGRRLQSYLPYNPFQP